MGHLLCKGYTSGYRISKPQHHIPEDPFTANRVEGCTLICRLMQLSPKL